MLGKTWKSCRGQSKIEAVLENGRKYERGRRDKDVGRGGVWG
jgi:hypothetical protein